MLDFKMPVKLRMKVKEAPAHMCPDLVMAFAEPNLNEANTREDTCHRMQTAFTTDDDSGRQGSHPGHEKAKFLLKYRLDTLAHQKWN
ncbi:hypothetical protein AV530_005223 [Patagioenas fasciata monilis]|uniref:Uncharacterized protein n=1 Tax=Patagioenas fasciata monilis TaxID=372326 RepID=A0A1V4JKR8_PATFA|nr:hypothetical protein AV530_005223 [Patagioenas fasciata monilis]